MRLSDDKISHMSHILFKGLIERDAIEPKEEEGKIRHEIRRVIEDELKVGEDMDETVRRKLQSFSRKIIEGSPEWEVLYRKFYTEEEVRRGRSS
ncbi:hypothetical protein BMS3Abin07_02335 [bacterium BMS3Abin07]|nr:hypothetical protein BMS3Abin07_02335 [bacterium BMS3Abin07]GBE31300.1 hypothetical protein BMS3Bbin05_00200 [bacterium BMS3Bbin05]HDO22155.1 DUF507 family protein [Nitrospirota bacterium]HDZ88299.1 DUF507 family protein [Nitrospirota bacterium]